MPRSGHSQFLLIKLAASTTMTSPLALHKPEDLLEAFCNCIERDIRPISAQAVAAGSKLFGAAILRKSDLSLVIADTNRERDSPLWHGETWTITQFFALPKDQRPDVKDCLFLTTHEPCSLCLSAIAWAGFNNFTYAFTYEETADLFGIGADLDVFGQVFHVKEGEKAAQASPDGKQPQVRPEYNLRNRYFVALSFAELLAAVEDSNARNKWAIRAEEVKKSYGSLAEPYRKHTGMK